MKRSTSVALAIVLLILAAVGARAIVNMKEPPARVNIAPPVKRVITQVAKNGPSGSTIFLTGRLIPQRKIDVFAEVNGVLQPTTPPFKEGSYFQKGQTLIRIDQEEFMLSLMAQKSSLMNQITLLLPDLKTDFPAGFAQWETYLQELDPEKPLAALPEPTSDREKYFISARNIYNLYYNIKSQEKRLEKYVIQAPFSGRVASTQIDAGTLVRAGQKLGEFFNTYTYEMEAAINLGDLEFVQIGNTVKLYSNDIAGDWTGKVIRISDRIDVATQTAKVYIAVNGEQLREGMYLNAEVRGKSLDQVIELPRSLLVNGKQIYIVKDSSLALHLVEPVRFSTDSVLLRGIPDGTEIVSESMVGAFEGMEVYPIRN